MIRSGKDVVTGIKQCHMLVSYPRHLTTIKATKGGPSMRWLYWNNLERGLNYRTNSLLHGCVARMRHRVTEETAKLII